MPEIIQPCRSCNGHGGHWFWCPVLNPGDDPFSLKIPDSPRITTEERWVPDASPVQADATSGGES